MMIVGVLKKYICVTLVISRVKASRRSESITKRNTLIKDQTQSLRAFFVTFHPVMVAASNVT